MASPTRPVAFRAAVLCAALVAASVPASAQAAPNIVVFLADDLGYGDVGPYDHDQDPGTPLVTNTPVLDALGAAGLRLTDYYSGGTVCSPSRAMLLTGRHNARVGVTGAFDPFDPGGLAPTEKTLAEVLRARGYASGIVGKWHLGDAAQFQPLNQGFDTFHGVLYSNDMWPFCVQHDLAVLECDPDQDLLTQTFTSEAKTFVSNAVADAKPFFLYLPYVSVHVPVHVSPAFSGTTGRGLYADAVREMDDSVGQILAHLALLGVDDETLVIFASDNGPWNYGPPGGALEPWRWVGGSAGPLRGWKGDVYEGGVRVPFIARWPGVIPAGAVSNQPVVGTDLFVTLAKRAGGTVPTDRVIDGRDVWPVLSGSGTVAAQDFFFYKPMGFGVRQLGAMRSGRWKLHFAQDLTPTDLYDLEVDIGETTPVNDAALKAQLADKARTFDCALDDPPLAPCSSFNLALRRPVTASSSRQCNTAVDAVDGASATYWESAAGDDQWLYVDLGAVIPLARVLLHWGSAHALQYQVEVSNDAQSWLSVYSNLQGNGGLDVVGMRQSARYVRVHGSLSIGGGGYVLREFKVHRMQYVSAPQ